LAAFFFGAAFFAFFIQSSWTTRGMTPARKRLTADYQKRGEVSVALPPLPRAAPYFFFFVAFLAAFFFAGIGEITPLGPSVD
jgi:hypothetical protein